ncbi:universal stress protein [Haloarculaceae archaeon H-GB2-1]|nr:universal stress protein [Haloarculaceae archaeon H-GB1-1]MEA5387861.1 universal stress protein [Haloarculaceae archaeon H-GB11]MEA5409358.1 universal stress protein [Haloarculaceae archaeon H-GB2-1]
MTLLVPYDGTDLSKAALERASEFASFMDADVVALTVVPDDESWFAVDQGWLGEDEPFDLDAICDRLREEVHAVAPSATFRCETTEDVSEKATIEMDVVRTIRNVADEVDAEIVFIGSENAGRVTTPVTSVGAPVSEDPRYDVHIVRHVD